MARRIKPQNRRPLILIKCEGSLSAEKIYFNNFSTRNCPIKFASGNSTDPQKMFEELKRTMHNEDIKSEYGDKIYLLIDTDLNDKQIKKIKELEPHCKELGITIITSSPTFEIWFLMHFRNNNLTFKNSKEVKNELKKLIPEYKETFDVYSKIKDNSNNAIKNAKSIEKRLKQLDKYSFTPHSYVYVILEEIKELQSTHI